MKNEFKVQSRQWVRWSAQARAVFNSLYGKMLREQSFFLPPKTSVVDPKAWRVVCWNAAWTAADACDLLVAA